MAIKGSGVNAVATMWTLTGITSVFVLLRAYTRVMVTHSYGIDDNVYNLAFVFLVLYTAFTTKSAVHGFGQNMWDIEDDEDVVSAILWEAIGQTFAVLGMAIAKWSLGLFLLRLVVKLWHKIVIWFAMGCLMAASISVCFVFWLQVSKKKKKKKETQDRVSRCTPYEYLWDRRIDGYCHLDAVPVSTTLNITTVVVDVLFAAFPWLFIWQLQIVKQEKIVILASLSLGLFAAACGIKRALEVDGLSSPNYLRDTVSLIVWSAIEMAVTLICIGIPVCRPLYKNVLRRFIHGTSGYYARSRENDAYGLDGLGGSKATRATRSHAARGHVSALRSVHGADTAAVAGPDRNVAQCSAKEDTQSDEEILLDTATRNQPRHVNGSQSQSGILVTEEVRITNS